MEGYILTDNILELIGNTPLLQLKGEPIFAKAEFLNPGSGETLQGVGKFLSEHKTDAKIIAVEPKNVSALLGREPGLHQIQGIGSKYKRANPDCRKSRNIIDTILTSPNILFEELHTHIRDFSRKCA